MSDDKLLSKAAAAMSSWGSKEGISDSCHYVP
jgi:hypothetical protein